MTPPIVTLTSDFGRDWYVGALRGAVLSRCPGAVLADITHDIPPHDVAAGAFALAAACTAFPPGSIHLAVVDPGVGGSRRPLALSAGGSFLVGPDNGLLDLAAEALQGASPDVQPTAAIALDPTRVGGTRLSGTFHGRDLFGPAAGALAAGVPLASLGEGVTAWERLPLPPAECSGGGWNLTIIHIDSFGNAVTNLRADALEGERWDWQTTAGSRTVPVGETYEDVAHGSTLLLRGSAGFVEMAVREGRADRMWGLARGSRLELVRNIPRPR